MTVVVFASIQILLLFVLLFFVVGRAAKQSRELGEVKEQNAKIRDELTDLKSESELQTKLAAEQSARFIEATEKMFAMRRSTDDLLIKVQDTIASSPEAKSWADIHLPADIIELRNRSRAAKSRPSVPDPSPDDGPGAA